MNYLLRGLPVPKGINSLVKTLQLLEYNGVIYLMPDGFPRNF